MAQGLLVEGGKSYAGGKSDRPQGANPGVGRRRVDFVWHAQRLVVEVDSWRWHGARSRWESDRRRDIRLQRQGYRVARVSYLMMVKEPRAIAEDIEALLSAAPSAAPRRAV